MPVSAHLPSTPKPCHDHGRRGRGGGLCLLLPSLLLSLSLPLPLPDPLLSGICPLVAEQLGEGVI